MNNFIKFTVVLSLVTSLAGFGLAKIYTLTKGRISFQEQKKIMTGFKNVFPEGTEYLKEVLVLHKSKFGMTLRKLPENLCFVSEFDINLNLLNTESDGVEKKYSFQLDSLNILSIRKVKEKLFLEDKEVTKEFAFYQGFSRDSTTNGYAFIALGKGYSSTIKTLVGINHLGVIHRINVLFQEETPGLGARVEERENKSYIWNFFLIRTGSVNVFPWFQKQFSQIKTKNKIGIATTGEWPLLNQEKKKKLLNDNSVSAITGATISTKAITKSIEEMARKVLDLL